MKPCTRHLLCALFCFSVVPASPARQIEQLEIFPAEGIRLDAAGDAQQFAARVRLSDTVTRDVTAQVTWSLADPKVARIDAARLHPVGDGETQLKASYEGQQAEIPVTVLQSGHPRTVGFSRDVMPVFLKAGCNTGSCHGSARGQDGFRLSLFGFDPDGDYFRLTREMSGRRINLAVPADSLLLTKATGQVAHTGGKLFDAQSSHHQVLVDWLRGGALPDPRDAPTPTALVLEPRQIVLEGEGATQQLIARVRYTDGSVRDVTPLSVYVSNNDRSVTADANGLVRAGAPGEAFIMARFAHFNVGSEVIVVPTNPDYRFPEVPVANYIDEKVYAKLKRLRISPSELCSDEVFLRRVHLDIVGSLPEPDAWRRFMADTRPDKRALLVDELLSRKAFVEMWVMKWAELLQIRSDKDFSYKSALLYYSWLRERIAGDVPIHQVVHQLLTARGGTFKNPATNYWQVEEDMLKLSENAAQAFMGIRLQCAQCHNHIFDRWTMEEYYGFAAFFAQIGRKRSEDPRERIIYNNRKGEAKHPLTQQPVPPKFLGGITPDIQKNEDRRVYLADWLTQPDNPYFARNLANIIWAHFNGRGIVEPVDDVRISNPPANEELLQALADHLVSYNYDFKKLIRDICNSRTYQLSTRANDSNRMDERNFSRAAIRRIRAEVLLDCISEVSQTRNKFKGLPEGARAIQIADGATTTYFLSTFGRATRESVCSCEVVTEPNLSQSLHLLNGDTTHKKIQQGARIARALKAGTPPAQILEELYLPALGRLPTAPEKEKLLATLPPEGSPREALEDIFWALLNAKEFIFNH